MESPRKTETAPCRPRALTRRSQLRRGGNDTGLAGETPAKATGTGALPIQRNRPGLSNRRHIWFQLLLAILWLTSASGADLALRTQASVMVEVTLTAARSYYDPFNEVTLDAVFTDPAGRVLRVPAFWDGGRIWKVRYASPLAGLHTFRTECSQREDKGLHGIAGSVEVSPYTGENPLYTHGPLRVSSDHRHLEHLDGQPFFWLGDTWWMGLCHRLHWPEEFQQLTADRKAKGFNVIQIVAGLYPDMFPFDPRGANESGFPWETNFSGIRPAYFDAADQRLGWLVDQGITPCIVGAWGYFMPWMGVEKMKAHWRYLIARYGAWPVMWCAAGEANLPWYLANGFPYDDRQQVHDWTTVMRYIRATDPWHRLLTIHPTGIGPLTARHATDDAGLLDFDLLQTPHARQEGVPATVNAVRDSFAATPVMPIIDGEASYEMLGDSLPTEWTRRMFWLCLMNGAAGHTYGANGIWQCNRPGQPHGKSPHGGSYGAIPWNEAMRLPGSEQVGFGKKLFEQFDWQNFRPHPAWAWFRASPLKDAAWIWYPDGNPAVDAPAETRFFRKSFDVPNREQVARASLRISADDAFIVFLNGEKIGNGEDWRAPGQFNEAARLIKTGANELSVTAVNKPASGANPAGLIASLDIEFTDGSVLRFKSDSSWLCSKSESAAAWTNALVAASYGQGPWGDMDGASDAVNGPQATGLADGARLIYAPRAEPLELRGLAPGMNYAARWFDPVTGATRPMGEIQGDGLGVATCPPPANMNHDWVLILEAKH